MRRWFYNFLVGILMRYEGAVFSPSRSVLHSPLQSARFDSNSSTRQILVAKSRYFERNSPIFNRLCDLFEQYVAGSALAVMPNTSSNDFNQKARAWWVDWEQYADLTSLCGFACFVQLLARTWFVDGEVFVQLTKGSDGKPRVRLIEGHRVRTPPQLEKMEGITVVDGVSIDRNGRPIGYWVGTEGQNREWTWDMLTTDEVIHHFEPSRTGQYRALPFIYPVINELHDLDDLHLLEMRAAKAAARIGIVNKNKTGDFPSPEQLLRGGFSAPVKTATGANSTEQREDYYQRVLGGEAVPMKIGDEISQFKGERPSVVTRDYWRYKTELVCSGVGIPYVLVFPDSMQGTVYRGALEMADAFFRSRFTSLVPTISRIYRFVMLWATSVEPALRDKPGDWWKCTVLPPRSPNVDVGYSASAQVALLEVGATNYELIYGPLGLNWMEAFDKLAAQQKYAKTIGLELSKPAPPSPFSKPGDKPKPGEEPEEKKETDDESVP